MARGYRRAPWADPRISVEMYEYVFDAINDHAFRCGESFTTVACELLRCAVEDGKLEEYFPVEQR